MPWSLASMVRKSEKSMVDNGELSIDGIVVGFGAITGLRDYGKWSF